MITSDRALSLLDEGLASGIIRWSEVLRRAMSASLRAEVRPPVDPTDLHDLPADVIISIATVMHLEDRIGSEAGCRDLPQSAADTPPQPFRREESEGDLGPVCGEVHEPEQPSLLPSGALTRTFGRRPMHRAGWYGEALDAIEKISRRQRYMTSDDLYSEVSPPPHHNSVGAVFHEADRIGLLKATGRIVKSVRPSAKRRNIQLWESALYEGLDDRYTPPLREGLMV